MKLQPYQTHFDPETMDPAPAPEPQDRVKLDMARADAVALFHAINRTMAILDDLRANADDGLVGDMDPADEAAYDMANAFIAQLQAGLQIDPDPEDLIAQQRN